MQESHDQQLRKWTARAARCGLSLCLSAKEAVPSFNRVSDGMFLPLISLAFALFLVFVNNRKTAPLRNQSAAVVFTPDSVLLSHCNL